MKHEEAPCRGASSDEWEFKRGVYTPVGNENY